MARKMKDSGIEWIGEIPEDWKILRLKHLSEAASSGLSTDMLFDDEGHYEVYDANNLVGYIYEHPIKQEYISIIKDGAGVGRTRLMPKNTNIIGTMNYITAKNVDLDFLYYLFKIFDFNQYSTGSTIPHIYFKDYGNAFVAIPNNISQEKISNLLNNEMIKIRNIYEIIKQQIQTLEDYKKSVITEAVTKGLDKNVEMKDSGIEWIGEIPKHWKADRLKNIVNYNKYTLKETTNKSYRFKYVDIGSVEYGKGVLPLEVMNFEKAPSRARRIVKEGDIIISTVRTYLKAIAVIPKSDMPIIASTGFMTLRTKEIVDQEYLKYVVQSETFISEISSKSFGVNYPAINTTELINIKIVIPPKEERLKIISYLDKNTKLINKAIESKQKQLEILEEYKKSLIYEYVTGKKEVEDVGTI